MADYEIEGPTRVCAATGRELKPGDRFCAVLVEVGFLTNPSEDRQLATSATVNRAAWGLRHGVIAYLKAQGLRP